jgi:hypothetical protein
MKKSRKEFIKKAHSAACSEWKKNIEAEFPNLFETKSFKKGDWVVSRLGALINVRGVSYDLRVVNGYGIDFLGDWDDDYMAGHSGCRLATEEEVEKALIAEAKKRGFKKGVMFVDVLDYLTEVVDGDIYSYYIDSNILTLNHYHIFDDGKWAEITETITKEQAEKELGKTIID